MSIYGTAIAAITVALVAACEARADDLAPLSTEFHSPAALEGWQEHKPEGFAPKWRAPRVEAGKLILQPHSSGWYEDNHAGHLFQRSEGDFVVTVQHAAGI